MLGFINLEDKERNLNHEKNYITIFYNITI